MSKENPNVAYSGSESLYRVVLSGSFGLAIGAIFEHRAAIEYQPTAIFVIT